LGASSKHKKEFGDQDLRRQAFHKASVRLQEYLSSARDGKEEDRKDRVKEKRSGKGEGGYMPIQLKPSLQSDLSAVLPRP